MAEVQLYKRGSGNNVIEGVDGTADSARFFSFGVGVASVVADEGSVNIGDSSGSNAAYLQMQDGQSAAVSGANTGRLRYNETTNTWQASENGGAYTDIVGGGGTAVDTYRWVVNGKPAVQTDVDNAWIAPRAGTITRITLYRKTAGSSGSTVVDVNLNGTTVYTTQGNRPTVTQAAGNDVIDATTDMDVTAVAQNDRLQVDVDTVEAGNPQDIAVMLEIEYT